MAQHNNNPYVMILEQPCPVNRFRYEREREATGSIQGVNSTREIRTYPRIKVFNYIGLVIIRVSCVDQEWPYRPHPHRIVGRGNHCRNGVYTIHQSITETQREVELQNIGVQCVKRTDVDASLAQRHGVDPFRTGFNDAATPSSFHHVRLAIEVLMPDQGRRFRMPMTPVVTDVITDRPTRLEIVHISHVKGSARGSVAGGDAAGGYGTPPLTIFTEKLPSSGVTMVRFFEESTNWAEEVRPHRIHRMYGMVVNIPPYRDPDITHPVSVKLELCHRSAEGREGEPSQRSNSLDFEYEPEWVPHRRRRRSSSTSHPGAKQRRVDEKPVHEMLAKLHDIMSIDIPPHDFDSITQDVELQPWVLQDGFDEAVAGPSQPRAECHGNPNQYKPVMNYLVKQTPRTGPSPVQQSAQMEYSPQMQERGNASHTPSSMAIQHIQSSSNSSLPYADSPTAGDDLLLQHYQQISDRRQSLTADDLAVINAVIEMDSFDNLSDSFACMSTRSDTTEE